MSKAGITVAIKGEINDLEAKITQSKEIINEATKQIIAENNKLKASQDAITNAQKTYANEIASAKDEIKKYIEIKSQNGKLTKEEQKNLASAKAELALYKIKTNELIEVEKQRQQEIRKTINASKELSNLQRASIADSRLEIDTKRKIIAAENEVAKSKDNSEKSTSNLANTTIRYLRWAGTIAGVVYAGQRAWDATVGSGIAVNKVIENNTYGIAALISANTQMVDSLGNTLTPIEKFTKGQVEAKKVIAELRTESTKTAATFPELLEIFQQGIGKTLSMGDAFGATTEQIEKNTIKLAARMSNFASAIGMPMDRVKEEMRSLISGNASTDSLIATIIFGSPGEANNAIKEAEKKVNGVADLLDKKFKPFDILADTQTFDKSILAIKNSWTTAMGDMVEKSGAFKDITNIFYEMSKDITANTDDIVKAFDGMYGGIKTIFTALNTDAAQYIAALAGIIATLNVVSKLNPIALGAVALGGTVVSSQTNKQKELDAETKTAIDEVKKLVEESKTQESDKALIGMLEEKIKAMHIAYDASKFKSSEIAASLTQQQTAIREQITLLEKRKDITNEDREIVAKLTSDQKQAGDLIANIKIDTERIKEDEKEILKTKGNIAEYEADIAKYQKTKAESVIKLQKAEEAQAQATKANGKSNEVIAANIATLKKDIANQDLLIGLKQAKINEENQKDSDERIRKAESLANKQKEQNKQLAEQEGIRAEIAMYLSGNIDTEQLAIEQQRIKIRGLNEEYATLTDKALQEKVLLEILKEQYSYEEKIAKAKEKEQKQYQFKQISGSINYTDMQNLGQIYQELLVYYKEDPESLAAIDDWVEREQNKLSKKPLVIDIKLQGWDEVSNSIATFGNSFQDINKAQKKYQQENEKVKKDEVALNQARVDLRDTTISGIADMTGAISNFYDEDDDRRKKQLELQKVFYAAKMAMQVAELAQSTAFTSMFVAQETAKGTAAGATAVAVAAQSSPWTGFATAAAMAALLASFGIMIGGKTKTSTSSDAFSSQSANIGTGSVLGDTEKQSESIVNALSILEDFANPQYQTLQSMNKYLATIANNISGVATLLVQNSNYALGLGYTNTNTGYKNNIGTNNTMATLLGGAGTLATAGALGGFGALGGLSVLGPAGLAAMAIDKLLLGGMLTDTIGGLFNSVLGGVFGKTSVSKSLTDSGIYFADTLLTSAIDQFNGEAYQTITTTTTKKSWFSKSSSSVVQSYFEGLDSETERQFSLVLSNLYNTVLAAGTALDSAEADTANSLANFVVSLGKISLKDKTGTEIQEILTNAFGEIGDNIAKTAFPLLSSFQQVGEGMFETLTRVATGMEEAEYYISRLGVAFSDISYTDIINKQGDVGFEALLQSIIKTDEAVYGLDNNLVNIIGNLDATAEELYIAYDALDGLRNRLKFLGQDINGLSNSMIYGAGSLDALNSGFEAYFEGFLTDSEQLAYQISDMQSEFVKLGIAMPTSKEAFSNLIDSLLSSESGQELYGRLIILSEAFANMSDNVDDANATLEDSLSTQLDTFQTIISGVSEIGDSFLTTIDSISDAIDALLGNKTGTDSTQQQIEKYFSTKSQIEQLLSKGSNLTTSEASQLNSLTTELSSLATNIQGRYTDNTVATDEMVSDLSDINSRLDFSNQILQVSIKSGLELLATESTVSNLEEYSKLQLEQYKANLSNETASLSSSTLSYGDYIGTQEKIDISKLLGVSYESAQPLIEQIQALSVSKNQTADVQSILGYTAGSTTYDTTKASQLSALSQYISGVDIGGIISSVQSNVETTKAQVAAQEALAKAKQEWQSRYDNMLSFISESYGDKYVHVLYPDIGSDKGFRKRFGDMDTPSESLQAAIAHYNEYGKRENRISPDEYKNSLYEQYVKPLLNEKTLKGYKVGGYTGDGSIDEIAGYTHRKEYVVNAPDLQALGGPNELKNMIEREKRSKSTINSNIGISNSKDDIIIQLGNQINILEKGFNLMINKLSDLVDFNEERKANSFPVTVSGTVTAIGA